MGFIADLLIPNKRATLANPPDWLVSGLGGSWGSTASGVDVTEESSLQFTSVLAAVRVLSESVASLPFHLYERVGDGKERAIDDPLYDVLRYAPNKEQSAMEYYETAMVHLLLWGNSYSEIQVDKGGKAVALWPLRPDRMRIERKNGDLIYWYRVKPNSKEQPLSPDLVMHLRIMGSNGVTGWSMIKLARQAIGLGLSAEEFGARFFGNNARPGVVLEYPGKLTADGHRRLRQSWSDQHSGLSNAHRAAVLEEGMTVKEIGIPPEDAQYLQLRKFQREEIASIYRVPPHMIGDLERATYSNIEHQSMDFVVHSLRPWLVRWEQGISNRVLLPSQRKRLFAEFLVDQLLRGDTQTRYQAYAIGRQWGWLSANDVRRMENMNNIKGGDEYLVPLNMLPSGETRTNGGSGNPGNGQITERALPAPKPPAYEERAKERQRLSRIYRQTLEDAAQRVINREVNDVGNAAARMLDGADRQDYINWLYKFYEDHIAVVAQYMGASMRTYMELIANDAAAEVGADYDWKDLEEFANDYLQSRSTLWCVRNRQTVINGLDEDDALAGAQGALDGLKTKHASKFAMDESTRIAGSMARATYALVGVTLLRWVAFGESCPFCRDLDGKVVEISKYFLKKNTDFEPTGADHIYTSKSNVGHPPLHGGCDCMVVAA